MTSNLIMTLHIHKLISEMTFLLLNAIALDVMLCKFVPSAIKSRPREAATAELALHKAIELNCEKSLPIGSAAC